MARVLLVRTALPTLDNKVTQPLGIMYIASSLLRYKNNNVKILDSKLRPLPLRDLIKEVKAYNPDIVGFSVLPLESYNFKIITKKIKELFPNVFIVAGGVYPTVAADDTFKDSSVDFAVIGEGEESICKLARSLDTRDTSPHIPGIAYIRDGELIVYDKESGIENLDDLPMPSYDLIDVKGYFDIPRTFPIYKNREYMSIFTSRACPFKCKFCHSIFGKNFRGRSPENVLSEIETLYYNYGIKEIQIIDDCFNLDLERAKRTCDLIIQSNMDISITFPNGIRGDIMDEELLIKLKEAGTYAICYGVQSGSERIQTESGSLIDLKRLSKIVEATDRIGVIAYGYCMIGFPGETKEELNKTLNYIKHNRFHGATFFFTTPFSGTEMSRMLKGTESGFNKNDLLTDYRFSPSHICRLSSNELRRFQLFANISIYFNIKRVIRFIYLIPDKWLLINIIKAYLMRIMVFLKR